MKFRLVDRITAWTPHKRITGIKAVSFEEYSLKEAFGDEGHLPETLLLECLLQLGNWLILLSSDFAQMGMVVKMAKVAFHAPLGIGKRMHMEVNLRKGRDEGFLLSGEGRADGHALITGVDCLAVPVPAKEYVNAEDLRVMFSEIYKAD